VSGDRVGIPKDSISIKASTNCNTAVAGSFKRSTDFLCYEKIIIEIKAASALVDEHRAQVLNYLTATGCKLGLLVNFGHYPRVKDERLLAREHEAVDLHL
jgi:GxxExxY protein